MCQLFKGVRGLNDVRRRGDSATLDAEATRDFATDQSTSATPYGDSTILGAEAARELATVPAQHRLGDSATLGAAAARGLTPDQTQSCRQRPSAIPQYLSSLVCS
jgi:hypothetical protein